jgi:hypothetical protein
LKQAVAFLRKIHEETEARQGAGDS